MRTLGSRLWWRAWALLGKAPKVCPARLHSLMFWRSRTSPLIDAACRTDLARNGSCWCGKLRDPSDGAR